MRNTRSIDAIGQRRAIVGLALAGLVAGIATTAGLTMFDLGSELLDSSLGYEDILQSLILDSEFGGLVDDLVVGMVFGAVVGGRLWRFGVLSPVGVAAYALFAAVAYHVAVFVAVGLHLLPSTEAYVGPGLDDASTRDFRVPDVVIGVAAGFCGALLLGGLALIVAPRLRSVQAVAGTTFVGAMAGVLLDPYFRLSNVPDPDTLVEFVGRLILYAGWQGAYAAALGFFIAPRPLPRDLSSDRPPPACFGDPLEAVRP